MFTLWGCWSTQTSREVAKLYEEYGTISLVAKKLGVSTELVTMYLPYGKVVYDLEEKSGNARRIEKWRRKKKKGEGIKLGFNALLIGIFHF